MPSKTYTIASIPGDGIGVEITDAAVQVLNKLSSSLSTFSFSFHTFDWSSKQYLARGWYMPPDGLQQLKKFDAIYFGAVGWPSVPDHISLWSLILPIRKALNQYVNVRPTRILRGTESPLSNCARGDLDWVIVRENSEGEYSGQGGTSHDNTPHAIATEVSIFTRVGIERIMRFAFETARSRPRKKLTMVTKSNAQRHGMVLWDAVFHKAAKEYPDIEIDKMLVDAMTVRMVLHPKSLDTIVATNLHADILSDLAAALSGSIGIAPSSNLDPTRENPSMFEPIHGSAPDIAGKGIANPVGAFWSAAEMVRWLGEESAADGLMQALENVTLSSVPLHRLQRRLRLRSLYHLGLPFLLPLIRNIPPKSAPPNLRRLPIHQRHAHRSKITTIQSLPPVISFHPHMIPRHRNPAIAPFLQPVIPPPKLLPSLLLLPPFLHPSPILPTRRKHHIPRQSNNPFYAHFPRFMRFPHRNHIPPPDLVRRYMTPSNSQPIPLPRLMEVGIY
ncbi:tartrate dehydrogenase [Sporormia fimetaria CBS 119925]|uniref:D-malate dehydrogenase (decarboxylating) n=1 Tax=Sporormia fimetaria CBS 119925 TaxID=1340428 RepID=A0A6A6V2X0_9PLEO|nr:tartrate dehydrogenase [Sporormia fimetaria CBS 119925]